MLPAVEREGFGGRIDLRIGEEIAQIALGGRMEQRRIRRAQCGPGRDITRGERSQLRAALELGFELFFELCVGFCIELCVELWFGRDSGL
ncbi:hypothetical protein DDD64_01295 [Actinotignum sanguinis]|nr:hypothetical protein DDD64_01295 [Actinotignum sanguinis]